MVIGRNHIARLDEDVFNKIVKLVIVYICLDAVMLQKNVPTFLWCRIACLDSVLCDCVYRTKSLNNVPGFGI